MRSLNVRTTEGCTHWSCFPYTVSLSADRWAYYWAVPSWAGGGGRAFTLFVSLYQLIGIVLIFAIVRLRKKKNSG